MFPIAPAKSGASQRQTPRSSFQLLALALPLGLAAAARAEPPLLKSVLQKSALPKQPLPPLTCLPRADRAKVVPAAGVSEIKLLAFFQIVRSGN